MNALGKLVVDPGVEGHLAAALTAGPVFSGGEQLSTDALAARVGIDVPAFDESDRM
jgi:hypothetical protein